MRKWILVILCLAINVGSLGNMTDRVSAASPANQVIRHLHVKGNNGKYLVAGQIKPKKRMTYYSVEDGHRVFIQDKRLLQTEDLKHWQNFKVKIDITEAAMPHNGVLLMTIYQRDYKGEIRKAFVVTLEKFYR